MENQHDIFKRLCETTTRFGLFVSWLYVWLFKSIHCSIVRILRPNDRRPCLEAAHLATAYSLVPRRQRRCCPRFSIRVRRLQSSSAGFWGSPRCSASRESASDFRHPGRTSFSSPLISSSPASSSASALPPARRRGRGSPVSGWSATEELHSVIKSRLAVIAVVATGGALLPIGTLFGEPVHQLPPF